MKDKPIWSIFWALVAVFVVVASIFSIPVLRDLVTGFLFLVISGAVLFVLGAALIVLTVDKKIARLLKAFLLLAGASAAGVFVFFLLHNLISGWLGMEEPFFFIMTLFICPLAFLVGAIGSIVLRFWKVKKPRPKARAKRKRA